MPRKSTSAKIATRNISWCPSYRIIPTQYPPLQIFEQISDKNDLADVLQIEAMTDDIARHMLGNLRLIAPIDRIVGKGAGRIMPSFIILDQDPSGSRFSNSEFGAYYAGRELQTALKETIFRREKFLTHTALPAQNIDNVLILADIQGHMHDIRGMKNSHPNLYNAASYTHSQAFAHKFKNERSFGIVYNSVRNTDGQCVAVLRPSVISNCRDDRIITYTWDGSRITGYFEKRQFEKV